MRFLSAASFAVTISIAASASAPALADTTGVVRGTITISGKAAAGVPVTLSGEGTVYHATTGAAGRFTFLRVPYGRYEIRAVSAEGSSFGQSVDLASGAVVDLPIDLSLKRIGRVATVTTRGASSQPVAVNSLDRAQIAAAPEDQSLNRLVETLPGIVRFSYNEPVAHGFHGLSYELDGIPLPQSTASNFSEVIDPRSIDSLEVFTGAFPAEFGGSRQGAVVNIISHRADLGAPEDGAFTAGFGSYGELQSSVAESFTAGKTRVFFNANEERSNRGIDSPTYLPQHDNSNASNQFLRTITNVGKNDTLGFDASNNDSTFEIPINTNPNDPNDPITSVPGTSDVQREHDSFFTLAYTHNAANGTAYTQIAPYYKYDRIVYDGDLARDVLATTGGMPNANAGLRQDRHSTFTGVRLTQFDTFGAHAVKAGIDADLENFVGNEQIAYFPAPPNGAPPSTAVANFFDNQAQRGTNFGAYVEDKWTPINALSIRAGLRYDHSTGYTSGGQLSPRFEINGAASKNDVLHFYFGRLYAAPFLEDTRAAAVVVGGVQGPAPIYDLKPERDSYYEFGIAHTISPNARITLDAWKRNVQNVLDTTQLANTPIFAVYNNSVGIAKGIDARIDSRYRNGDTLFVSAALSQSLAGGISGGTFLFPPASGTDPTDVTLNPEDHDQTLSATLGYTKRLGRDRSYFATIEPEYGTGYPVNFQNGATRLPPHLTANASFGREAGRGATRRIGFKADFQNFTNTAYILKIANGFNTTQWGEGFQADLRITAPF